jgi:hypothetical protein
MRRSVRRLFQLYTTGKLRRETFPGLACMQLDRQQNSLRKIPQCMFGSSIVGPQRRLISTVRWRQEEFNSSSELSILSIRQGMFCQPNCGGTYRPFCSISDSWEWVKKTTRIVSERIFSSQTLCPLELTLPMNSGYFRVPLNNGRKYSTQM